MTPDPSWASAARTSTATVYDAGDGLLVVWPDDGCRDDELSATQSVEAQHEFFRAAGRSGGTIVMMDAIGDQTNAARRVYQTLPDASLITCFALVGGSTFGRAVSSIFLGLVRPQVPTKAFARFDDAAAWVRAKNAAGRNVTAT